MSAKVLRMDRVAQAWKDVYATPSGKIAVDYLMSSCGAFSEAYPQDPVSAGIAIGERNVAAKVARFLSRKPEDFVPTAIETVDFMDRILERQY